MIYIKWLRKQTSEPFHPAHISETFWRRWNWNEVSPAPVPACTAGPSPEILPPSVQRRRPSGPPWCSPFQRKLHPRGPPNHRTCPRWLSCPSLLHHPERNHKDLYPHKQARSSLHYLFLHFETMKLDLNPIIFELCTKSHCQHPHAAWHQRKQYSGTSNVLGSLPAALQSQSVRWAAGDRWCPRPGSVKAPRLWWPFPSAPSSAPPHTRYHRAARRSPQCALFWGSQRHFPGRNELLPTERWTLC